MICPKYRARPERDYRVNEFITPNNPVVREKAIELKRIAEREGKEIVEVVFNFVSLEIKYVRDKKLYGYEEFWAFPEETLMRKLGDCEDTSFLLASLLIASGIYDKYVRVVLGKYRWYGHAWVEIETREGWYILESTSDSPLEVGKNAWKKEDGYKIGYNPELYVYRTTCELVGHKGLYDRFILYY